MFSELLESGLMSIINLGKFLVIVSNISFGSFFSFWYSHYVSVTPFVIVPQFLDILFFFILFSISISVVEVSTDISSSSLILSSAMSSLLMSSSKAFFHFCYNIFFISSIPFWFLPKISISLLIWLICFFMLSTFSIRDLSIFIIVVWNFWSHKSNISAICEPGCIACSVSSNCAFVF